MKNCVLWLALGLIAVLVGCQKTNADAPQVEPVDEPLAPILPCMSWDRDVCKPRLFHLLSDPSAYDGITVELMGYATWGERSLVVYPSIDMACSQTVTAGVELDHAIEVPVAGVSVLEKNGVVSIVATGVFKSDNNGLAGRYVGHMDDAKILQINFARTLLKTDPRELTRAAEPVGPPVAGEAAPAVCR